ncbi:MAG: hypothetical protein IIB61_04910 [Planctomycetes bacterium]|nr:hypothetical protein [Planctomycetota bacterium]
MKLSAILLCSLLLALGSCKPSVLAKAKTIDAVLDRHEATLGAQDLRGAAWELGWER